MPARIPDTEIFGTLDESRRLLARLVNCSKEEIALMPNTSHGINLAANSLPLHMGDVVLTFEKEFPANVYPWMALADRGIELRFIPCVKGLPDEARLMDALDDKRVRAVAVSWVSFSSGYRVDLERLGNECRSRGIFLAVDGIQGLGALRLDLSELKIDIFANGCQKWLLSPWGTGFVYVRKELIPELRPRNVGWLAYKGSEDFSNLTSYNAELRDDARRFEVGSHGLQDYAALNASLGLFLELGPAAIEEYIERLAGLVSDWAGAGKGVTLLSPTESSRRAGVLSLGVERPAAIADVLREEGIACSVREGSIRLSTHFYNTEEELRRVFETILRASTT